MIEIRWHGRGGQGVVTAASILGAAAMYEGKHSQAFPFFGAERRGAPVSAFTRIDTLPIRIRSQIYRPDWVILMDDSLLGIIDPTQGLAEGGGIIVNTRRAAAEFGASGRVIAVDAIAIGFEALGMPMANTAMLGAVAAAGLVGIAAVRTAIRDAFGGRAGDRNVAAAEAAYQLVADGYQLASTSHEQSVIGDRSSEQGRERGSERRSVGPQSSFVSPQASLEHAGAIGVAGTIPVRTGDWALSRPVVDGARCNECLLCWIFCPDGTVKREAHGSGGPAITIDQDYCKGCGICARECPRGAISMVEE